MATVKQIVGSRTSLGFTSTSLSTLASATYVQNTTAYDCTTNQPMDVIVEVDVATTNSPSGNKQVVVFIQESLDGTNYRSGPTSGTTTTREPNLQQLGAMPVATLPHEAFKAATRGARAVVRTGEFSPYANVILRAGVVF